MTVAATAALPTAPNGTGATPARPAHGLSFHQVLSALNPLQYLPVVGTIYRAVTGDVIPESVRRLGSLVVSGLLGGPIGIAINIATTAAEKISGIDLDGTGQALLHGAPIGAAVAQQSAPPTAHADAAAGTAQAAAVPPPAAEPPPAAVHPWSAAQLAAYGVQPGDAGTLRMHGLQGAEVLNSLELTRLYAAHAAYTQVAALAP